MKKLVRDEDVSFSLEVNIEKAHEDLRKVQMLLYRTLGLMRRFTGSEAIDEGIMRMQQAIAWANRLRLTLLALQAARMAAGDPLAWATFGLSAGEMVMSTGDLLMEGF